MIVCFFFTVSVTDDSDVRDNLFRILYNVIHGSSCDWVPSVKAVCQVLVNYGSHLSQLCPKQLLVMSPDDLRYVLN